MTPLRILVTVLLAVAVAACGASPRRSAKSAASQRYGIKHEETLTAAAPMSYARQQVSLEEADETPPPADPSATAVAAAAAEPPPAPEPAAAPTPPEATVPAADAPKPMAALPPGWRGRALSLNPPSTQPKQVANDGVESGQMLIYTANLTMAVYQVEQGLAAVEKIAHDLGGYLATRTDRTITIRVPRAQFETALKMIEPAGDVVHREIKAEDVTDEFFDLEVRLRNARAMRDRLAKLLQQAAVKEALDIEKELSRVTEEIERIEGKLKLFRHRVAYSTLNIAFQARGSKVETRPLRLPFSWLDQLGLPNLLQLEDR
jgi:hypothetical protein